MTTLAQLADRVQDQIDDAAAAEWSQAEIEGFVVEGIRDYSQHFPRLRTTTINVSAGTHKYDLPPDFRSVKSVEYPGGDDPPGYLRRKSYQQSDFWNQAGFYDIVERQDATDLDEIWIGESPTAGQTIVVEYLADHDLDLLSGDDVSVPAQHEHIIVEYAVWRAFVHLQSEEQKNPTSSSSLLMNQLSTNAERAKRNYVEALGRALRGQGGASAVSPWTFDKYDRIY